ncbi:MAG: acetyltransferase [Nitrospinae bacterium]|nr:acetyltransferase [Nitrospinota bacterium]
MANVVVFGMQDFASLAHFYLKHDSPHKVVAFSVTKEYLPGNAFFEGLPVVPFEDVERSFGPGEHDFFAPMSYRKMNRDRAAVYESVKEKGYKLISYVSAKATIYPGTEIGDNCFILENNNIQPFSSIGNNVVLWSGNQISHHCVVKDHVFVASQVAISGHCVINQFSFLGLNSSIREGLRIGEGSLIAMSAAVIENTDPWGIYMGVPARKTEGSSNDFEV